METTQILNRSFAEILGKRMQNNISSLAMEWQQRLELQKNSISIFVPVEERRQGLLEMMKLVVYGLQHGTLQSLHTRTMAIARLRSAQGFNLKDSLEEALVLEDLLFGWVCKTRHDDQEQLVNAISIVHRVSHTVIADIARVHVQAMDRNLRKRQQESFTDGLTRLFNYRFFTEFLQKEICRSQRYRHTASLVILDVDWFKKLNDRLGHVGGDQILIELARLAQTNCRTTDLVCRYGGEEFAILLPETPREQAALYCERLRSTIEKHPFHVRHSPQPVRITISMGLANYPDDSKDSLDLIHKADQAMYMAKRGGRNRVCFYARDGALQTA